MTVVNIPELLARKAQAIRLAVFDVDGTLTDGMIWLSAREEAKCFHIHDGLGLKLLREAGVEVALITARESEIVARRAGELGIVHLLQGVEAKGVALRALQETLAIRPDQTASMGDDLPDLALFRHSGLKLAVPGAVLEVQKQADWIAGRPPGRGAARDAAEMLLKAQGRWPAIIDRYL